MFEIGDRVVYGIIGICEVEDINQPPIKGIDGKYYFLQPVYDDKGIIYAPVDSNKVHIRPVMSKEEAEHILDLSRECKGNEEMNAKLTANLYDDMIKSQEPLKLLHLIRFLYNVKNERAKELRKMKSMDSRILAMSRKLLYGEMAVALDMDLDDMSDKLDEYLSQK
jgi:CarD family transcriptional regulator